MESIGKENPISLSGGVSLSQIFYSASGIQNRRAPYSYFASGNVNLGIYGWNCPVSFSVSNQQTSFQQPFNQYSLHPTYKWITAHVGYTSMSFSPYTVNGHIFLGAGVDAEPHDHWKFSALYGRFSRAVDPDTTQHAYRDPTFRRMGIGFKATYAKDGNTVDISLFRAKDDQHSISFMPDSLQVFPEENLVVSIGAAKRIFEKFLLKGEFATSAITRDVRSPFVDNEHILARPSFLYRSRTSSSYYNAFKTAFDYLGDGYTLGVGYEKIEPEYRTHGAYFFNNDLENITVNGTAGILEGKMNVAVSAGTQRDNLDKTKVSTMRRMIGAINVNYMPSERLNFSGSYSTFQTYTNIRSQFVDINQLTPYDNLDTLNFTQISKSASLNTVYNFGKNENRKQSINLNLAFQNASDKQGEVRQNSGMQFYNLNASYAINVVPALTSVSGSVNATFSDSPGMRSKTIGPTLAVNRMMFNKKLRTTLSASWNNSYMNNQKVNTIFNGRLMAGMMLEKKHNLNLSTAVVRRQSVSEGGSGSFLEFTGTLGYSYTFGIK